MTPVVLNLCPPCLCTQNKARHLRQKWKGTNNNQKYLIYKACLFLLDTICRSISRAIFLTPSCARTQPRLPMFTNIEGVYRLGRCRVIDVGGVGEWKRSFPLHWKSMVLTRNGLHRHFCRPTEKNVNKLSRIGSDCPYSI